MTCTQVWLQPLGLSEKQRLSYSKTLEAVPSMWRMAEQLGNQQDLLTSYLATFKLVGSHHMQIHRNSKYIMQKPFQPILKQDK